MSNADISDFFPQIKGNLSRVTWAHSVNSKSYLDSVLTDGDIMMIEADVVMGKINKSDTSEPIPIMAHPPNDTSDLTLAGFLTTIAAFNSKDVVAKGKGKGVKLDFKSIEAFNASLQDVSNSNQQNYPLWLNADILQGPVNASTKPVDSVAFLTQSKQFSNCTLSLGWTTNSSEATEGEGYKDEHITKMIGTILANDITNRITFPVRASLTAHSCAQMSRLLKECENSTLTIWTHPEDTINVDNLKEVILKIGVEKVFLDVQQELRDALRLDNSVSSKALSVLSLFFCILVVVF